MYFFPGFAGEKISSQPESAWLRQARFGLQPLKLRAQRSGSQFSRSNFWMNSHSFSTPSMGMAL